MIKKIAIIVAIIASVSYYNDNESLTPWVKVGADLINITTKVVKASGHELHKVARSDDGVLDTVGNWFEDTKYDIENASTEKKIIGAVGVVAAGAALASGAAPAAVAVSAAE
jgi:hypothetical protein